MTPNPIVPCPACESGELRPGPMLVRCPGCGYALSRDLFLALRRIRALPEAARSPKEGAKGARKGRAANDPRKGENLDK